MTTEELRTLIQSDATASALAAAGNDTACAERCMAIAPKEIVEYKLTELGIMALYSNPADAEMVLVTIETVAQGNPIVARVLKWIQPGAPGVDFGNPLVRSMLVAPVQSGGVGLSAELAAPLLASAERTPVITAQQIGIVRNGS